MRRTISHSARIILYAGLALGFVQETALAQLAKTEGIPIYGGQGGHAGSGGGYHPGYPIGAGAYYQRNGLIGGGGYSPFGHGSHPGYAPADGFRGGDRSIGGGGWGYRPRFGAGFPGGCGGMAGLFLGAGMAAAANAAAAQQASPPPQPRRQTAAHEHASASPPPKAIAHAPPTPKPPMPRLASNAHPPPAGETRFRPGEVLIATAPGVPREVIDGVLRRHRLAEADATAIALTGYSLRLWRFSTSRAVPDVVRELGGEMTLASIQPNYIYAPQDEAAKTSPPFFEQ